MPLSEQFSTRVPITKLICWFFANPATFRFVLHRIIKLPLHWQIAIALVLAVIVGSWTGETGSIGGVRFVQIFDFIGQLFLRLLKMLIVPLIASAIITGVASIGNDKAFGRLGAKTFGYYFATTLMAILIGLVLVNWIKPGLVHGKPIEVGFKADASAVEKKVGGKGAEDVVGVFLRMIPENVVSVAGNNGEMLALIFFSILFGYFMSRAPDGTAATLMSFWQGVYQVMVMITDFVMKVAPIGVFGLVASVAAATNLKDLVNLLSFFLTVVVGLSIHLFIVLPLLVLVLGKVNPVRHFKAMLPALLTAFSTSSSSATIPVTMECLQKGMGVSPRINSFVTPLGATVNMNGTALYECVSAIFIAQVYGLELSFTTQFIVVALALLTSIGVAGVPSASLVAIVVILGAIGLPAEGIGLLMFFDRVLDMGRTAVNIFGDACGAVIIAQSERELNQPSSSHYPASPPPLDKVSS